MTSECCRWAFRLLEVFLGHFEGRSKAVKVHGRWISNGIFTQEDERLEHSGRGEAQCRAGGRVEMEPGRVDVERRVEAQKVVEDVDFDSISPVCAAFRSRKARCMPKWVHVT